MYLAIDVGGSKTLLAGFTNAGERQNEIKIETPKNYADFLKALEQALKNDLADYKFSYACCALPGRIDRKRGIGARFGNLPWQDVHVQKDVSDLLDGAPVLIENDAKLGGLSEALLVHKKYKKVLYITLGTGIGGGIIIDGKIDPVFADMEPGNIVLDHNGKLQEWEDIASGKALVKEFGQKASHLESQTAWKTYANHVAKGLDSLLAVIQPEVVIIGGGIGAHFDKFGEYLNKELKKLENNMVIIPPVIQAKRPEDAVIYGCYELIKQKS